MDVKEAIALAKTYVREIFSDEKIVDLGLEEVEFRPYGNVWRITLGFARPSDQVAGLLSRAREDRIYKTVEIEDGTKVVRSVKNRDVTT